MTCLKQLQVAWQQSKTHFQPMTLPKKYRQIVTPTNDWLFELDFNACELRVALALLGHDQPEEDLHDWNLKNVFTRTKSREKMQRKGFFLGFIIQTALTIR